MLKMTFGGSPLRKAAAHTAAFSLAGQLSELFLIRLIMEADNQRLPFSDHRRAEIAGRTKYQPG